MVEEGVIQTTVEGHQSIFGEEVEGIGPLNRIAALIDIRVGGAFGAPMLKAVTAGHVHAG